MAANCGSASLAAKSAVVEERQVAPAIAAALVGSKEHTLVPVHPIIKSPTVDWDATSPTNKLSEMNANMGMLFGTIAAMMSSRREIVSNRF